MVTQQQNLSTATKKLTDEELSSIQDLSKQLAEIIDKFGQIKIEKLNLQSQILSLDTLEKQLETDFYSLKEKELNLSNQLSEKYGNAIINLTTGELS